MLTTGAMRLAVSRGHQTWYHFCPLRLFAVLDRHCMRHRRGRRGVVNNAMDTPNTAPLGLNKLRPSAHLRSVAANCDRIFEFFHILARYFHETRGSLNFLTVHSCSQNLPLISCMYAYIEVSTKTDAVMLNFYQWCKTPSSALSKKNSATTPKFFARFR